jgi:hypothetical protein
VTGNISGAVTASALTIGATAVNATADELNSRSDDSAMIDSIAAAGAVSVSTAYTAVALVGTGAITLAAPSKPAFIKVLKMTADNGDVTMSLANVVGGSAATTATFNDVGDTLVLVSDAASGKWVVIAEVGVVLS